MRQGQRAHIPDAISSSKGRFEHCGTIQTHLKKVFFFSIDKAEIENESKTLRVCAATLTKAHAKLW